MRLTVFVFAIGLLPPADEFSEPLIESACSVLNPARDTWAREAAVVCGKICRLGVEAVELGVTVGGAALEMDGKTALSDIFSELETRSVSFFMLSCIYLGGQVFSDTKYKKLQIYGMGVETAVFTDRFGG